MGTIGDSLPGSLLPPTVEINGRIFGVDEAGRGAMAGPLAVAAVEYPWPELDNYPSVLINDSKTMTRPQRLAAAKMITTFARYAYVTIGPEWIDKHGIQDAENLALLNCISMLADQGSDVVEPNYPDYIICDGTRATWNLHHSSLGQRWESRLRFMIKADQHVPAVSAASIVAKTFRDNYMENTLGVLYPQYGFQEHMGYVTKQHLEALEKYGSIREHRHSFRPVKERDARGNNS